MDRRYTGDKEEQKNIQGVSTFPPQLLAALLGATAMATWHAALFMEMEKVHEPGFPLTWPDWLQVQFHITDLQHSEATHLNLSSSHSQPSLSAGCNHGGHGLELPGGLVGSLPHLGRLPCHLRLRHRPQGPAEELGGGLDEDEAEVEQHVRGAQLLPGSKASQSQPSHGAAAAVSPKWVQPSRIPTSLH